MRLPLWTRHRRVNAEKAPATGFAELTVSEGWNAAAALAPPASMPAKATRAAAGIVALETLQRIAGRDSAGCAAAAMQVPRRLRRRRALRDQAREKPLERGAEHLLLEVLHGIRELPQHQPGDRGNHQWRVTAWIR
jgi:hypothetical protein